MTPHTAVFRRLFEVVQQHIPTYDYLPDGQAEYPFAYIGESYSQERNLNDFMGNVHQTIHLYGTRTQRKALDQAMKRIHDDLYLLVKSYGYYTKINEFTTQIIQDNTTGTPLLHYVIDAGFIYTKER